MWGRVLFCTFRKRDEMGQMRYMEGGFIFFFPTGTITFFFMKKKLKKSNRDNRKESYPSFFPY